MKRSAILALAFTVALIGILPFAGGTGPSLASVIGQSTVVVATKHIASASVSASVSTVASTAQVAAAVVAKIPTVTEHVAQKPVRRVASKVTSRSVKKPAARRPAAPRPAAAATCPGNVSGAYGSAPGITQDRIGGTTSADLVAFASRMNAVRVAHCLQPIPVQNFRYNACIETRLFWMAEDPSTNPGNTWGHAGVRSLAVGADGQYYSVEHPSRGCDSNLAGGFGNTGTTVAQKWWDSLEHRASLYRPSFTGSTAHVCIQFAMTHGGIPNEGYSFTRAGAIWTSC